MVVEAGACAQIFVGYNHCGYHRYSTKLYGGLPPPVGGGVPPSGG